MLHVSPLNLSSARDNSDYDAFLKPLITKPPLTSCEVCVIVPVRNEAEALSATLLALINQVDLQGRPLAKDRYEIIVLANNCSDNSAEIARNFARSHSIILHTIEMTIDRNRAHIGWVRKLLMDEAYRRLKSIGRSLGIIASTDGDTRVAPTWIAATLAEIENGADAVGGRIVTDCQERNKLDRNTRLYYLRYLRYGYLSAQLESCLDPNYEPFPRHHHHYGASLAVTAQMYAKVGGLPPLPSSEDVALYNALKRADARFCHSPMVRVITSARVVGRAKAGLSERLSSLNVTATHRQTVLVEPAELIKERFVLRYWLRYFWRNMQQGIYSTRLSILADRLELSVDLLEETIVRSPTFGLLVEQIEQHYNYKLERKWHKVPIQKAIADLNTMIRQARCSELRLDSLEQIEPILLPTQPL